MPRQRSGGRSYVAGLGWALLVLATEVAFTLLAVPVLGRLGPWAVSLHAVWIGAVAFIVLGLAVDGPGGARTLNLDDLLASPYLAVVVTALAYVLWYSSVRRLGAGRAGQFTGVVPVTAAVGGVLLGGGVPAPAVRAGTAVVALGLAIGFGQPGPPDASDDSLVDRRRTLGALSPGGDGATRSGRRRFP